VKEEKEAERRAREKAEQERIEKEREKKYKEWKEREAKWRREQAERARKEAAERRAKQEAEAREKEWKRIDGNAQRAFDRMKEAERRLRRWPENPRYQKEYRIRRQQYNQAESKVNAFMDADEARRSGAQPRTSAPGTAGGGGEVPTAAEIGQHQAQDKVADMTGKVAGHFLTEGSASAGRTTLGVVAGQVMDAKAVYDLGQSAQDVVDKSGKQIKQEMDAIDDPNTDPMEIRHHQWKHTTDRFKILMDTSSP
jgi:hypothetical protein